VVSTKEALDGVGAIVAGGASGLGEATVRRLEAEGAHVVIADRDAERGEALAAELGDRVAFAATDVRSEQDVAAAVERAASAPRGLRVSVTCAGVAIAEKTLGRNGPHALDSFERVVAVNLIGTFNVLRLAAAAMRANDPESSGLRGVCVNTASIAAYEGQIGQAAYAASKGAVAALTLPAARDLASHGIRVVTIAPGLFETPMLAGLAEPARQALAASIPCPQRLGHPEEYADLVVHIACNDMLNGSVIRLDGALRMAPR
jgi:NAD(P)-dependent dehydrogenase (short-subunit alcohol dehydrogenase family)